MEAAQLAEDLRAQGEHVQARLRELQACAAENRAAKDKESLSLKRAQVGTPYGIHRGPYGALMGLGGGCRGSYGAVRGGWGVPTASYGLCRGAGGEYMGLWDGWGVLREFCDVLWGGVGQGGFVGALQGHIGDLKMKGVL